MWWNILISVLTGAALFAIQNLLSNPPVQPAPIHFNTIQQCNGRSPEQLREEAKKQLGINSINEINFAFVGETGVGKSSLINAIRNLHGDKYPFAAPTGYTETTQYIERYRDPNFPHIVYWDLPGSGSIHHPAETYWDDKKLYAFDHLLIIGAVRFHAFDINIAKVAMSNNVPITFIRTKMDQDIENKMHENPNSTVHEIKQSLRQKIVPSMKADLARKGISNQEIFLVNKRSFNHDDEKGMTYVMDEIDLMKHVLKTTASRRY